MTPSLLHSRAIVESAVSLRAVQKSYSGVQAVRGLDLEFDRGETVALLGPNGAGKSTTIGMMLGLVAPDVGEIRVGGRRPRQAVVRGTIAAMLQDSGLMPGVRVSELVTLAERLYPNAIPVAEAIELAGLTGFEKRRVDRLSGGQSQRLRFAIAIVANPEILVLDEPTRALDVQGRAEFWVSMRAYAGTGRTVLFATHYLDEVDENAQRVVVMAQGRVVADGAPSDIRGSTGLSLVRFRVTPPEAEHARKAEHAVPAEDAVQAARAGHAERAAARFPGVVEVAASADRITLRTTSPDDTVRALAASTLDWRALEVSPPSLDESFLSLTAERS